MSDAKNEFSLTDLRTKTHNFFLLHDLLLGRLHSELFSVVAQKGNASIGSEAGTGGKYHDRGCELTVVEIRVNLDCFVTACIPYPIYFQSRTFCES